MAVTKSTTASPQYVPSALPTNSIPAPADPTACPRLARRSACPAPHPVPARWPGRPDRPAKESVVPIRRPTAPPRRMPPRSPRRREAENAPGHQQEGPADQMAGESRFGGYADHSSCTASITRLHSVNSNPTLKGSRPIDCRACRLRPTSKAPGPASPAASASESHRWPEATPAHRRLVGRRTVCRLFANVMVEQQPHRTGESRRDQRRARPRVRRAASRIAASPSECWRANLSMGPDRKPRVRRH
ncbi:hypothetical protein KO116_P100361 (plasmid) [Halomonas sp. KO116]|nr:hypothetical protein KO116_P100361 [Halomonas sp. KO116]